MIRVLGGRCRLYRPSGGGGGGMVVVWDGNVCDLCVLDRVKILQYENESRQR